MREAQERSTTGEAGEPSPHPIGAPGDATDAVVSAAPPPTADAPPSWLRFLALAAAAGVLTFGFAGLLLAVNGWYRPGLAFPLGGVAWVAVLVLARPAFAPARAAARRPVARHVHVYAALGVVAIVAITGWNAAHASQHVLLNRDGGSYTTTGRWIARDGSLVVKPRVGPFANEPTVGFNSPAVYQMPDGTLQFQFAHFLPAVLAEAYAIKGDTGLFHAADVLGGIALLAFFVLAWRLVRRPLFALAAMLALGFLVPQVWYSRDTYSEIPSQILLFTALWLLTDRRLLPRWRLALASGLFLGALEMVRIDAFVFLLGVPVVMAVAWLRATDAGARRHVVASSAAFVAGLVPGIALGLVDLTRHSGLYWSDLSGQAQTLMVGCAASVAGSAVLVVAWPYVSRIARGLPWARLASVLGAGVTFVGFVAWIVRPHVQHMHGVYIDVVRGLQTAEHVPIDGTRLYFERSFTWMGWYLGPLTLVVALVAAGLVTRAIVLGRLRSALASIAVLVPGSLLYLYKADAVPDQVWVTRRFLVSAFPLLVLLALGLAAACAGLGASARARAAWRAAAVAFAVVAVGYPLYTVVGLRAMSEQRGFANAIHETCAMIGSHAVVVVLEGNPNDAIDDNVPQTLRSYCGADVGITRGTLHADALHALARSWRSQGRTLYVVAGSASVVRNLFPGAPYSTTHQIVNTKSLQLALVNRPKAYARQALSLVVAPVPPD